MIHSIVYDAVRKKAETTPPNDYIGNVEMAAGIGLVLKDINMQMDFSDINTPNDVKEVFLDIIKDYGEGKLKGQSKIIYEKVVKYKVKKMVNETMEDIEILVKMKVE